ncbi:hypothetical protein I2F27_10430 [Acinetobacter sp. B5B]|uniref:hypothetical protein n=1 Tax=Acinetobacter baretiae TaxID=2605383 RepID=UPI0018C31A13|nr:hypothetical protein [Acinetobacter baretiae]MBF7683731.1 hypothetical protein [Acinetobacter baretiae]
MWKKIRIAILLAILLVVAVNAWRDQNQNWNRPVVVLLHPVNADGTAETQAYIQQLQGAEFGRISHYLKQSAQQYGQNTHFIVLLGRTLVVSPPEVPTQGGMLQTVLWSLKFRYYAWQQKTSSDPTATVVLYLNYYSPKTRQRLLHSTALERGRIGSVNLFSDAQQSAQNDVVITHELLHAFGATDKYDLMTGQPIYPSGYAHPELQPRLPQHMAELMAGYIPVTSQQSKMPNDLEQTMIGQMSAKEIGWLK